MMTRVVAVLAVLATVLVATPVWAQDGTPPPIGASCEAGFLNDYWPCVPIAPDGDWNCSDQVMRDLGSAVRIDGGDPYGFDADGDGYGCDGNGSRPPQPPVYECNGLTATIVGTEGDDVIRGTDGDDVIMGLGGNDRIFGLQGKDVICGGEGRDRLLGGKKADVLIGGPGGDKLFGDAGADQLLGGEGNDRLSGGLGDDVLDGERGRRDRLFGGVGVDTCVDNQAGTIRSTCEG